MNLFTILFAASLVGSILFLAIQGNAATDEDASRHLEKATFAGGCFWCMEKPFEEMEGVLSVTSGYTGGSTENPTYDDYAAGGHMEAVEIVYDPEKVSYARLLDIFWRQVDPTDPGGQFVDRGNAYSTAIFYHDEAQRNEAERSLKALRERRIFDAPIVTPILPAKPFHPAEEYHQDYYRKNPLRYSYYRKGSGRDAFLNSIWGSHKGGKKWSASELREKLTPLQYRVTQEEGTEPAFDNEYWNNKAEGIYVDIVSGEPLFSSVDKYDSGTGWPSFSKPLEAANIVEKKDWKLFMVRTEVRSREGDSHLGHVFDDGPAPTGKRYCINSAALRFIPRQDMEKEGYDKYLEIFRK